MHLLSSLEIYSMMCSASALFPELNDREDDNPLLKVKVALNWFGWNLPRHATHGLATF